MDKKQINLRLSLHGHAILETLITHLSKRSQRELGRDTTQVEVVEMALRLLARQEKIPVKSAKKSQKEIDNV